MKSIASKYSFLVVFLIVGVFLSNDILSAETNTRSSEKIEDIKKGLKKYNKLVASYGIEREIIGIDDSGEPIYEEKKIRHIFDFNSILPMPQELEGTSSPPREKDKKLTIELKKKFGHGDWYSWREENWGTKWNTNPKWSSCITEKIIIPDDSISKIKYKDIFKLIYVFRTAWSPPEPVIKEAAKKFPKLLFKLSYYEYVSGWEGCLICQKREVILDIIEESDLDWR